MSKMVLHKKKTGEGQICNCKVVETTWVATEVLAVFEEVECEVQPEYKNAKKEIKWDWAYPPKDGKVKVRQGEDYYILNLDGVQG